MVNSTLVHGVKANFLCIFLCGYRSEVIYRDYGDTVSPLQEQKGGPFYKKKI